MSGRRHPRDCPPTSSSRCQSISVGRDALSVHCIAATWRSTRATTSSIVFNVAVDQVDFYHHQLGVPNVGFAYESCGCRRDDAIEDTTTYFSLLTKSSLYTETTRGSSNLQSPFCLCSTSIVVFKQHGQRGPLLACAPCKALNMPKRLSACASCDSEPAKWELRP